MRNNKMKIGMFTEVYKPCLNGVVYSLEASKAGLENLGNEVYVYSPHYKNTPDSEKGVYGCFFIPLRAKYYGLSFPSTFSKEAKQKASELDVVHVHHPGFGSLTKYGAKIAKKQGIPLVLTSHTQYTEYSHYVPFYQPFVKAQIRRLVSKFGNSCDCIISPSPKIRDMLISAYSIKTRIEVIPNSIDTELFKQVDSEQLKKKYNLADEKVLIFSGRLEKEKNLEFLIKSFSEIKMNYDGSIKLLIVGDGSQRSYLETLAGRLNLRESVIFTGKIPHEQMPLYYSCADIFVTASKTEVHPLTVLEAMSVGIAAVGLNAPGVGDTIENGKNGILVNEENTRTFAEAVVQLLKNQSELRVMSRSARATAEKYSISKTAEKLYKLYKELIELKKR